MTHRAVLLIEIIWIKKGISYQTREDQTRAGAVSQLTLEKRNKCNIGVNSESSGIFVTVMLLPQNCPECSSNINV